MVLLPIVDRELRVAARRKGTFRVRLLMPLALLIIWWTLVLKETPGHSLLIILGLITLAFSAFAGIFLTSDCLSEEKREGTLGLLFLTDLKARDVVFGKLTANSLNACFGLLAVFPIIGLTLLLGEVTGQEFWRLVLVFVVTLFFSLGIGMGISATSHEGRQAMVRGLCALILFAGVLPALWWLQELAIKWPECDFLLLPNPVYAFFEAFDTEYLVVDGPANYWASLATLCSLGVLGILSANFYLPRTWQDPIARTKKNVGRAKARTLFPGGETSRTPLWWNTNPIFWLGARDRSAARHARHALILFVPIWFALLLASLLTPKTQAAFIACTATAFLAHLVIKTLIALEAARRFNLDRRSGALELLLTTPLSVREILLGQLMALRTHFFAPLLVLATMNILLCATVMCFGSRLQMPAEVQTSFLLGFIWGVIALVLDFLAFSLLGMWLGLKATRQHRAVAGTLGRILGGQWLLMFLLFIVGIVGVESEDDLKHVMIFWFLTGLIVSCIAIAFAAIKLSRNFRCAVLDRAPDQD